MTRIKLKPVSNDSFYLDGTDWIADNGELFFSSGVLCDLCNNLIFRPLVSHAVLIMDFGDGKERVIPREKDPEFVCSECLVNLKTIKEQLENL